MTENLPATRDETDALVPHEQPVARADVDSWVRVIADVARLADHIASTEFVPAALRGKPAAVTAAILYGREVGLAPMTALTQTHVIEGRPSASAEAMRALVIAAGHELRFVETTGAVCTVEGRRRGSNHWTRLTWSLDMARAAGLLDRTAGGKLRDNWHKYPRRMLQARATSELCQLVFPDVIHGMTALEEVEDDREVTPEAEQATVQRTALPPATPPRRTRKRAAAPAAPPSDEGENRATPEPAEQMPLPGEDGYGGDPAEQPVAPTEPPAETTIPDTETTTPEAEPNEPPPAAPPAITRAQQRMILARLAELGLPSEERAERLRIVSGLLSKPVASGNDLTKDDASAVIDTLARVGSLAELLELVDQAGESA
jgi:hypothetical protein